MMYTPISIGTFFSIFSLSTFFFVHQYTLQINVFLKINYFCFVIFKLIMKIIFS